MDQKVRRDQRGVSRDLKETTDESKGIKKKGTRRHQKASEGNQKANRRKSEGNQRGVRRK